MGRYFAAFSVLLLIIISSSCGSGVKSTPGRSIIKSSSTEVPDWVMKKKTAPDYVYFTGIAEKSPDLKSGRQASIDDATSQLIQYIGFRATTSLKSVKSVSQSDNISSFKQDVEQTINGTGSANVTVDMEDFYYEEYSDGTYDFYALIRFPDSWVNKERENLKKLTADQRQKSQEYLNDANSQLSAGNLPRAMDFYINSMDVSSKAAENSDLYNEGTSQLNLILSGLTFTLNNTPKYAYIQGGSDPVEVKAVSSKTGGAVSGILMDAFETGSNATLGENAGQPTGSDGTATYTIDKVLNGVNSVDLAVTFSMSEFDSIKDIDEDFYSNLMDIRNSKILSVNLSVADQNKAVPMVIALVAAVTNGSQAVHFESSAGFQEKIAGKIASMGYNIITVDLPLDSLAAGKSDSLGIKDSIIAYIKSNYPSVKRLFLAINRANNMGVVGKDITFSSYNLNNSDLSIVEMKLSTTVSDIGSGKVISGTNFTEKGVGLNSDQASGNAEGKILNDLTFD